MVFEKTAELGGLWTANGTAIWKGMTTNVSKFVSTVSDHPWPADTRIYPTAEQVCDYFRSYAKKFDLEKHILFRHKVEYVTRLKDHSWSIRYKNLANDETKTETFDFFMIASGVYSTPIVPKHENVEAFKGIVKHSSRFQLNDPELKNAKNILVVGGCISAIDLTGILAATHSVTHLFRRKFAVVARLWREKLDADSNLYSIQPLEFFSNKRSNGFVDSSLTKTKPPNKADLKKFFSFQANNNPACPEALRIDFDNLTDELISGMSDRYIDAVKDGKIQPVHSEIDRFDEQGVYLKNGEYVKTDAVVYCTGYNLSLDYLDREVIDALKLRADKPKFAMLLFKNTFVPGWETMAFIGHYARLYFTGFELQAMWATSVFGGKVKLPERSLMEEYVRKLEERRNKDRGAQFPYGSFYKLADDIARELDLMPDLRELEKTNPQVFDYLWNDEVQWSHYLFDKRPRDTEYFMNMFRVAKEIRTRVYEIDKKIDDLRQSDIEEHFFKFYKY